MTQAQLVELYGSSKANVSEHIKHIFEENELNKSSVVRKFRTTASDGKNYTVEHYNLDMVISLGYRIKSKTATQFRIWATNVLKDYTLRGVAINQKRLDQLGKYLDIISRSNVAEIAGVGEMMKEYISALDLLEAYDEHTLLSPKGDKASWKLTYEEARNFLDTLRDGEEYGENFARERNGQFEGIVAGLYQTFDEYEL